MSEAVISGSGTKKPVDIRAAEIASEVFAPWICAAVMPPLVGAMTTVPWWRGALHGLLVTVLSAGIPYAVVARGVHTGRYDDHHVSRREDRPRLLLMTVGCVVVSLLLVRLLGATTATQVFTALMLTSVAVGAVISHWWKISLHALVLAASVTVLVALEGKLLPLAALVPVVGWSRWRLQRHSWGQVVAGSVAGVALAAAALPVALR
ncbi:phosphatidic acid phosphatase [Kineococcus indalonis]|uniref:phosphatidic acid phosphatase n=1 Tax=Kineococcus indalonis TaxID=2696566 RepID=UPI0014136FAC|nr:phosphatidic acid phosphatase [Kineococcus indalonis]NAZ85849.1 phosphatidic acid phosphatase [Kineococcus indalonis]